jgi:DnaJ-class molecular chaperone
MKQLTIEQKAEAFDVLVAKQFTPDFCKDGIGIYDNEGNSVTVIPLSLHGLEYDLHAAIMRADSMEAETENEPGYCRACSGSGEGMFDGTTCSTCRGRGE